MDLSEEKIEIYSVHLFSLSCYSVHTTSELDLRASPPSPAPAPRPGQHCCASKPSHSVRSSSSSSSSVRLFVFVFIYGHRSHLVTSSSCHHHGSKSSLQIPLLLLSFVFSLVFHHASVRLRLWPPTRSGHFVFSSSPWLHIWSLASSLASPFFARLFVFNFVFLYFCF